jgi:anti-sigma regulatory factor (Ser/Thr protein kinase)
VQGLLVAAGEAVANAIEHGHRDSTDGVITIAASAMVDRLELTVVDRGAWKAERTVPDLSRGRGIALMRALVDDVTIAQEPTGTTVSFHTRIAS